MKRIFISLTLILLAFNSNGQEASSFKSSIFYIEVGGNAQVQYSLNYERVFYDCRKVKLGYRGGVGIGGLFHPHGYDHYAILANAFGFIGKTYSHLEFGAGLAFLEGSFVDIDNSLQPPSEKGNSTLYLPLNLSYRFQKPKKGIFFKVGVHPSFKLVDFEEFYHSDTPKFTFIVGGAIGYSIPKKIRA